MMKLLEFGSHDKYVKAQKRTVGRRGPGPFFCWYEMKRITDWMKDHGFVDPLKGVCHGARNGLEADEFLLYFPSSYIIGTDLFPHSGASAKFSGKCKVKQWDFTIGRRKWRGAFDFVYSNSFDHARFPVEVLKIWMRQLKPDGAMFLQWSRGARNVSGGDCFGAELYEFITLVNTVGTVVDLLYCKIKSKRGCHLQRRGLETVVLIVKKKESQPMPERDV